MLQQQMGGQKPKVDANESWQQKQQKAAGVLRQPLTISAPPQTSMLQEGAVIPLVLMTALNNTLPGHVSARVTTNVYDSIHGDTLAIPAGSRLEGNYNEHTLFGQKRMMFAFSRIIMPSGASIRIAAWNGSDAQGRAGVEGEIDNHLWEQFGTGLLLGVAGWLLQPSYPTSGVNISTGGGLGYTSMGDAAGQTTFQTASGILSQYQNMKPEVNVAAGSKLSLIVLQDISLAASGTDPNAVNQTDANQANANQANANQASSNQGDHN
jgi:type IV secretion system protein VirB10